ncbi:MAG: RNA polymerase sigma-70 factor [Bacteroidales bacterium]|nr:RNA polymerase sigma-70 factor [Bacteroidales bacterium]MCL2133506.1 RNA polymerase sigma-70 factor [Bacteroidales bacterium]
MISNTPKTSQAQYGRKNISPATLQALREGSHSSYENVYLHYVSSVKNFLTILTRSAATAEEITQEVFVTLWEKRENIDPDKNISGYLYIIAKNFALKHFNKNKIFLGTEYQVKDDPLLDVAPDEILIAKEKQLLTAMVIKGMPPKRKKVYELSRKEGLSNGEIADRLQISKNTVENHITTALKELREVVALLLLLLE